MSLLDDVSIVVTPNGYKAGELYGVIPVPTEGSELVTDGDFSSGSNWYEGTGCTISGNQGIYTTAPSGSGFTGNNSNAGICNVGKRYTVVFTIDSISLGALKIRKPFNSSTTYTETGTYTETFIATDVDIYIQNSGTTTASISNVSVKEYTSADMDVTRATAATRVDENGLVNYAEVIGDELVTNGDFSNASDWDLSYGTSSTTWSISDGKANATNSVSYDRIAQVSTTPAGTYKITINISSYTSGTLIPIVAGQLGVEFPTEAGVHTQYITGAGSSQLLAIASNPNFTGSIDNVSVKEVTRDNVPRIDYTGGGCPHILAEPQRTNLIQYSEAITQANGYSPSGVTLASNQGTTPMGTNNATKLTSTGTDPFIQYVVPNTNATFTLSVYAKGVGSSVGKNINFFLVRDNYAEVAQSSQFTLTNEWVRYTATLSLSTNPTTQVIYRLDAPSVGVAGDEVLIWGAQLEEGSYATSYIPTSGSTVTRNQDIFTRDGIGSLINSTEGVLFAEMAALSDDGTFRSISLSNGTPTNRVTVRYNTTSNSISAFVYQGTSTILSYNNIVTDVKDFHKLAIKYKSGDLAFWVDGIEVATSTTSFTFLPLTEFDFDRGGGDRFFFGKVKQLQVYNTALTDEQLLQLTGTSGTDFYESYAEMASALTYTIQ